MTQQQEQEPGRGPVEDQHEDGVVVEPGGELDRDLAEHGLAPEPPAAEEEQP
ncbi:MAG: hypothetical protein ACOC84_04005 [Actinomycetota bacterium]